ncbi:calcium-binding protein [Phenylobacterium sp.]|jgi:hypothetical protein|uniref:calcium-binding protein n=1 Tax=Phenylobacterium sp. TaxID=1871053 RepID=UPI002E32C572|nr:calcium-binding protein [Phenylobacterium sp.]HEX2559328.1 calcium-binding protein [Phenylobacterium sp.]
MAEQASFIFYGVVEDDYAGDPEVGAGLSAAPYGYAQGETVGGRLTLTEQGTAAYLHLQAYETSDWFPAEWIADFTFERAQIGDFNEGDIHPSALLNLASNGTDLSLTDLHISLRRDLPGGDHVMTASQARYGGVLMSDGALGDYGDRLLIAGAWLPSDITPTLIYGGDAADVLTGQGEVSLVWGGLGNDVISFGSGAGYGWGGQGNDTLRGGDEEDQLWGGLGDDSVQGRGGADHLHGLWGDDTLSGGDGDDTLDGGRGAEDGSHGRDVLRGDAGNDLLIGHSDSADTLLGGAGDDVILSSGGYPSEMSFADGGTGDDLLVAHLGGARLKGGGGYDVFEVTPYGETVIEDFKPRVDRIDLIDDNIRWDTFQELMTFARQDGAHVVFEFDRPDTTITLRNTQLTDLRSADFIF